MELYGRADIALQVKLQSWLSAMAAAGPVGILVNNAGINRNGHMHRAQKADWDAVIDCNGGCYM